MQLYETVISGLIFNLYIKYTIVFRLFKGDIFNLYGQISSQNILAQSLYL